MHKAKILPKPKQTLGDLLKSNQLVKGKTVLEKKLAEQKILEEAIEFEMRNRRAKSAK